MLLSAIMLSALGTITSHWLPLWDRGIARAQQDQTISLGLDRLFADLGQSQFVPRSRDAKGPFFVGTKSQLIFVRPAIGPNSPVGLDIVRIGEVGGATGWQLVRERTQYLPSSSEEPPLEEISFRDPVVIFRSPIRTSFAYADDKGAWTESWSDSRELPAAIAVNIRDESGKTNLALSTIAKVRVDSSALVVCATNCGTPSTASWDGKRLLDAAAGPSR
jgi:general secretion pathway protein J